MQRGGETPREETAENYNINDDLYRMIRAAPEADQPCPVLAEPMEE